MEPTLSDTGIMIGPPSKESGEVVGEIDLAWFGKRYAVEVIFESDDGETPNELQVKSFCDLISHWDALQNGLTQLVIEYWISELRDHGQTLQYDATGSAILQIGENTSLTGILIASMNGEEWCNYIGVLAECSWSPEHGLGVKLVNGSIVAVGHQDLVT